MSKKKIVVLTGAGISAESGIKTYRDSDGLWENHDVMEVASIEGWHKNPELVLNFFNERRLQVLKAEPNEGHKALVRLEEFFDVCIITQNVDNLHEKAGSSNVLHLHGELSKMRSSIDPNLILDNSDEKTIKIGDLCPKGSQLRPHIVFFGEAVPKMVEAVAEAESAEVFIVVGTSLNVYPAAGLLDYVGEDVPKCIIDPNMPNVRVRPNTYLIEEKGSVGVPRLVNELIEKYH